MGEIQWDKLTPGQAEIVREVQARYRNKEAKDSPLSKELIKEINIQDIPIVDDLVINKHKFIETPPPTFEISKPIIEPIIIPMVVAEPKPVPRLKTVIDSILHSKVLRLQKDLMRGDINIAEFVSTLECVDCSMDFIEDKLDQVRMNMMEYFGLDMDKERMD